MEITLKEPIKKKLKINKTDGTYFFIVLKNRTLEEAEEHENKVRKLHKKLVKGKITSSEYTLRSLDIVCENLNRKDFEGINSEHLSTISEAVLNLRLQRNPKQKKNPSRRSSRR